MQEEIAIVRCDCGGMKNLGNCNFCGKPMQLIKKPNSNNGGNNGCNPYFHYYDIKLKMMKKNPKQYGKQLINQTVGIIKRSQRLSDEEKNTLTGLN